MSKPDVIYRAVADDTVYEIMPCQDAPFGTRYKYGAEFRWKDNEKGAEWSPTVLIEPKAIEALGLALLEAAKDVESEG